jgi:hypothetical protein
MSVVDLSRGPGTRASRIGQDGHGTDLEGDWKGTGGGGSSPSGDLTVLSSIGATSSQGDVGSVGVSRDIREVKSGDIVGVSYGTAVHEAGVPGERGERAKSTRGTAGVSTITGSSKYGVRSKGSTAAVGSSHGLGAADERSAAGV